MELVGGGRGRGEGTDTRFEIFPEVYMRFFRHSTTLNLLLLLPSNPTPTRYSSNSRTARYPPHLSVEN